MAKKESQKSLDSWTKEEWGTKSGKNSTQGKNATGERYLPKKARESLSDKEYARSTAKKRAAIRKGQAAQQAARRCCKENSTTSALNSLVRKR